MLLLGVLQAQAAGAPVGAGSYDLLETQVLASSAASVTFSSLSTYAADYQHLQLRMVARRDVASIFGNIELTFNGDTGSNYRAHRLRGTGSAVQSTDHGVRAFIMLTQVTGSTSPTGSFSALVTDILDFSNTNKNTTTRTLQGSLVDNQVALISGLYNSTAAITQLSVKPDSGNFVTGSRFSLYGLKAGA